MSSSLLVCARPLALVARPAGPLAGGQRPIAALAQWDDVICHRRRRRLAHSTDGIAIQDEDAPAAMRRIVLLIGHRPRQVPQPLVPRAVASLDHGRAAGGGACRGW